MIQACTFPVCLQELMNAHQLTFSALGTHIGSRAELKRALSDQLTDGKRMLLCEKLCQSGLFSQDECISLRHSLEVSRIGMKQYINRHAIAVLLNREKAIPAQPILLADGQSLANILAGLSSADELELLCINCCYPALFTALAPLFAHQKLRLHMRHYIQLDSLGSDAARFVACVSPILFDARYLPYGMVEAPNVQQSVNGNLLSVRIKHGNTSEEMFFFFVNDHQAYSLPNASNVELYHFFSLILDNFSVKPALLKEMQGGSLDYPHFVMSCLSRELNRGTYALGTSIAFQQVPTETALAAFYEKAAFPAEAMETLSQLVRPIHEQRYQNFYHKKKPNYVIYTEDGIRTFLETGESPDHFFGFRAFTKQERLDCLHRLLIATAENPHLVPLLLKQPDFTCNYFVICYDKLG